jgi:RNA polymerase sigma-70 factor (ECF subfamily)
LRALRNTYATRYRTAARRSATVPLAGDESQSTPEPSFQAREIMHAIASAPARYRDAVTAVDVVGLSYKEAASALRTREATITTRLHRGRRHVARVLIDTN